MAEIKRKQESTLASLQSLFTNGLRKQDESEDSGAVNTSNPEVSPALNTSVKTQSKYIAIPQGNLNRVLTLININEDTPTRYNKAKKLIEVSSNPKENDKWGLKFRSDTPSINFKFFNVSTLQLFYALLATLHNTGAFNRKGTVEDRTVYIPIRDYMALKKLKSLDDTRKQVNKDLEDLWNNYITHTDKVKGREVVRIDTRIISSRIKARGQIGVIFSEESFAVLKNYPIAFFPLTLWEFKGEKRSYGFYFLVTILLLARINAKKSFRISVKTLIKYCPSFPKYDFESGQVGQRFIKPFVRGMDDAKRGVFEWYFCHEKGKLLSDKELERNTTYNEFMDLMVQIELEKDYPDLSKIPLQREEQIQKAIKRKEQRERRYSAKEAQTEDK